MAYMKDADGNRLDAMHVKATASASQYRPRDSYVGVATADAPTVTVGNSIDGTFNKVYIPAGGVLPANWPVDAWGSMAVAASSWLSFTSVAATGSVTTYRMMADGSDVMLLTQASNALLDLYVDGQPYASNPIALSVTTGLAPFGFTKLVFGSAKPRLLEFRSITGVAAVYTKNPYRLWKPSADANPKIAVVGDSWVYPTTLSDTTAANASPDTWLRGAYQRMAPHLGLTSLVTDGIGSTGYINGGAPSRPYGHATRLAWLAAIDPDVIVVHGGGINDLFGGSSEADIITAATAYFTALRAAHPDARLIFVEGFIPPGFAAYAASVVPIRQGVQAALNAAGIDAYYLDVATTQPPIFGTGYVTATNGTGNSDLYVGFDTYHLSARGHEFVRRFLAPKIARVLADNGDLAGQLII